MKMKKNSFMQGAFIATLGIVICKILGILYVIPFHSIIGEQGGALYGYAYNIYTVFLSISQAGIPLAMSKIISEYDTLGYYKTKERAFKLGKTFLFIVGLLCFLALFFFAEGIGDMIIGNIEFPVKFINPHSTSKNLKKNNEFLSNNNDLTQFKYIENIIN